MYKLSALVILVALRIFYHPASAAASPAPFSDNASWYSCTENNARVISASGNILGNKIFLNWAVSENETADIFEIEKSTDGKHFRTAALVFGTDKSATDNYQFYEKAGNQRFVYRIKLVDKDKKTAYSAVIVVSPAV